jgi:hypothetical protein
MSHRVVVCASALSLSAGGLLGCGPTGSPTARPTDVDRTPAPPTGKRRDVHVDTPGAKVDVHRDTQGNLKVDVRGKDRATNR